MCDVRATGNLHLQRMTTRLKDQESLVDRLRSDGANASQEIERLLLLRRALEEMLLQLPGMIPSDVPAPPRNEELPLMLS
jgi:hypothetical protein